MELISAEINKIKQIRIRNLELAMERGDKIEVLVDKTTELSSQYVY